MTFAPKPDPNRLAAEAHDVLVRQAALEEAARCCEEYAREMRRPAWVLVAKTCAKRIRALAQTQAKEG